MTNDLDKGVIAAIRELYKSNPQAQALFDVLATRKKDASETSVDNLSNTLNITRGDAVELARTLEETGCGRFLVGRKGWKSRFEWEYSVISLGRAAAGESADLEKVADPVPESDDDEKAAVQSTLTGKSITISEAKQMLAASFGVPVENIEIIVRG